MDLERSFKILLLSRVFRSIGIISVTLSIPLYLAAIKISVINIGLIFAGIMLFMIFQTLLFGIIGDRYGYKKEMLFAEFITATAVLILALTSNIYLIILAMLIGGIGGGGAGGMRGAFSPGSNAYIANNFPEQKERIRKYGLLNTVGSITAVLGGLLMAMHGYINNYFSSVAAYRIIFLIAGIFLIFSLLCILALEEVKRPKKTTRFMKKASLSYTTKIILANSLGGIGMGVAIPLLPLWLSIAYHATAFQIGIIFSLSYIATAAAAYLSSLISHKYNILNIVSLARIISGFMLFFMALSPFLSIVALFYILRSISGGFGSPARSTINIKGIDIEDFGTASSVQGIATRVSQLSSGLSGYLMDYSIPLPLEVGGIFQIFSGVVYKYILRNDKINE